MYMSIVLSKEYTTVFANIPILIYAFFIILWALVPAFVYKHPRIKTFYLLLVGIIAFVPIMDMASLVHLIFDKGSVVLFTPLSPLSTIPMSFIYAVNDFILPIGILGIMSVICLIYLKSGNSYTCKGYRKALAIISGILFIPAFFLAGISFILYPLTIFLLLLLFTDLFLEAEETASDQKYLFMTIYILFALRGLYVIMTLLQNY